MDGMAVLFCGCRVRGASFLVYDSGGHLLNSNLSLVDAVRYFYFKILVPVRVASGVSGVGGAGFGGTGGSINRLIQGLVGPLYNGSQSSKGYAC